MAKKVLLLSILASLALTACNKEANSGDSMGGNHGNNSIQLAKITTVDNHGDNKMSVRFDWSEDRLRHVYIIEEGDLKYEFTLDYEDNIIKRKNAIILLF